MKDVSCGASSGLVVRAMEEADQLRWDAYVEGADDGTFFHLAGWKDVLERAFGHRTYFLLAEEDGAVCGVLPMARVKSWLFGDALSSLPFCVYGGPVARDGTVRVSLAVTGDARVVLCLQYPGGEKVFVDTDRAFKAAPSEALVKTLEEVLGEESVYVGVLRTPCKRPPNGKRRRGGQPVAAAT